MDPLGELLYNASVLAHYAQISVDAEMAMSAPADLTAVFDQFVSDTTGLNDPLMMETAGAQWLLLAGFFEDQMRRRHARLSHELRDSPYLLSWRPERN